MKNSNTLSQQQLKKLIESLSTLQSRAFGCVVSAMIGDSLGSYMEFSSQSQAIIKAEKAMQMPGGGIFDLSPGQITDDTQLAVCMSRGILKFHSLQEFDIEKIAKEYYDWYLSGPYDIGKTTENAFNIEYDNSEISISNRMINNSINKNEKSESNGGLMRITPMIIYSLFVKEQQKIIDFVEKEISLTHPNIKIKLAATVWVLIIRYIILTGNINQSYQKFTHLMNQQRYKPISQYYKQSLQTSLMKADSKCGWSKIAWSYGFYFLKKLAIQNTFSSLTFQEVMLSVLKKGGDTDTNACIVGGMIGAIVGINNIPMKMIMKCINYKAKHQRNGFHAKQLLQFLSMMFAKYGSKLNENSKCQK